MKHSKYSVYLHSQVESQADIRCYINSASLFGNPMQRKQLQQQRRTISDTGQKKCLGSRHFAPVPPWPRYAAPAPSICYVGFPPIFPPFHSTSTVVEHYARYAAAWWKQTTSLFSPPPLRVMRALSIFWRHYKHCEGGSGLEWEAIYGDDFYLQLKLTAYREGVAAHFWIPAS